MTRDPDWLLDGLSALQREHLLRPRRLVQPLGPGRVPTVQVGVISELKNNNLGILLGGRDLYETSRYTTRNCQAVPHSVLLQVSVVVHFLLLG